MSFGRKRNWYVIFCKPHQEIPVNNSLVAKGFEVFYPAYCVRRNKSRISKLKPFFPRYLFVKADLAADGTSALDWIPGAVGLVRYGDTPAIVPQYVVDELKKRLAELSPVGEHKFCHIEPGDHVRIVRGPFAGYEAIFDASLGGSQRVQVLLEMLDRQVKVSINQNAIESFSSLNC